MKNSCLSVVLCLLLSVSAWSQTVRESESLLVYYMPFTTLVFDIDYEEITEERGVFYQYSERYLRTTDIVKEDKRTYRLTGIRLRAATTADTTRAYTVPFNEKYPYCSCLSLTKEGILLGVNAESVCQDKGHKPAAKEKAREREEVLRTVPFLEEQLLANSTAKMAENTAKQIYRIRESRLNLLSGDVEHLPNDGRSMQLVLEELDAQEKALTQLFVGKRIVRQHSERLSFIPTDGIDNDVLFRFSMFSGVVSKDDMSGNPYYIHIDKYKKEYASSQKDDEKVQGAKSPICYNIPGQAHILLNDGERTWVDSTIDIAQWGIAVALPYSLFKKPIHIEFYPKTGAIKSLR